MKEMDKGKFNQKGNWTNAGSFGIARASKHLPASDDCNRKH
jgi:hypothetical protein